MAESKKKDIEKEQLELGKQLQAFYDMGYVNKKQALVWSLLKGAASGIGAVIGGTILLALVLWLLSAFDTLPLIGPVFDTVKDTIDQQK